nr:GNAT family N-acetyltransferase [Cellulomonas denverensis]
MTTHADRHHPLLDPDRPASALHALLGGLRAGGLPGLVQLQHLPTTGPVADALTATCTRTRIARTERRRDLAPIARRHTVLAASPDGPEPGPLPLLLGHLTPDDAKNARRRLRGIARDLGAPATVQVVCDDPALDDEFIAFQHAGWKGQTAAGASLRQHPARERWFRDVTGDFRKDGDLLGFRLSAGDRTLWIGYLLRSGDSYFGFLDAFAEEHGRFSPGALGRLAALTHVFTRTDAPLFDPGFDARYAVGARLFPDRREQVDVLVATGGALPRLVVAGWPWAVRAGAIAGRTRDEGRAAVGRVRSGGAAVAARLRGRGGTAAGPERETGGDLQLDAAAPAAASLRPASAAGTNRPSSGAAAAARHRRDGAETGPRRDQRDPTAEPAR